MIASKCIKDLVFIWQR